MSGYGLGAFMAGMPAGIEIADRLVGPDHEAERMDIARQQLELDRQKLDYGRQMDERNSTIRQQEADTNAKQVQGNLEHLLRADNNAERENNSQHAYRMGSLDNAREKNSIDRLAEDSMRDLRNAQIDRTAAETAAQKLENAYNQETNEILPYLQDYSTGSHNNSPQQDQMAERTMNLISNPKVPELMGQLRQGLKDGVIDGPTMIRSLNEILAPQLNAPDKTQDKNGETIHRREIMDVVPSEDGKGYTFNLRVHKKDKDGNDLSPIEKIPLTDDRIPVDIGGKPRVFTLDEIAKALHHLDHLGQIHTRDPEVVEYIQDYIQARGMSKNRAETWANMGKLQAARAKERGEADKAAEAMQKARNSMLSSHMTDLDKMITDLYPAPPKPVDTSDPNFAKYAHYQETRNRMRSYLHDELSQFPDAALQSLNPSELMRRSLKHDGPMQEMSRELRRSFTPPTPQTMADESQ